jgi:hypothetical protein
VFLPPDRRELVRQELATAEEVSMYIGIGTLILIILLILLLT